MNKDMINIDDFVRGKLGGHEEKEDPAAWLRMKALLDKEMPERAVPFWFRMRKPLGFMACALLVSALCVGGYKMMESSKRDIAQAVRNNGVTKVSADNGNTAVVAGPNDAPATMRPTANAAGNDRQGTGNTQIATKPTQENTTLSGNHTIATTSGPDGGNTKPTANKHVAGSGNTTTAASNRHTHTATHPGTSNTTASVTGVNSQVTKARSTAPGNNTTRQTVVASSNSHQGQQQNNTPAGTKHRSGSAVQQPLATSSSTVASGQHTSSAAQQGTTTVAASTNNHPAATGANNSNNTTAGRSNTPVQNTRVTASGAKAVNGTATQPNVYAHSGLSETNQPAIAGAKPNNPGASNAGTQQAKDSAATMSVVKRTVTTPGVPRKLVETTDTTGTGRIAMLQPVNEHVPVLETTPVKPVTTAGQNTMKQSGKPAGSSAGSNTNNTNNKTGALAVNNTKMPATATTDPQVLAAAAQQTAAVEAKKKQHTDLFGFIRKGQVREIINNITYDVGHAQFYFGVNAGANRSMSSSATFTGMNLGLTGEFVFNKHLSLMGELKYFNRTGNKKVVNDDYTHVNVNPDSTVGGNNYFTLKTDSTSHFFNFSMLHSFELPITLRYAINKFYVLTGINLAYYLGINTEEGEIRYANVNQQQVVTDQKKPYFTEKKSYMTIGDFSSRFGVGYVFGAGYQINPALQIDLRVTNTFWDNASSIGAKQVSQNFYKIPSFQLTLGYQFNRDRGKPTFGPKQ